MALASENHDDATTLHRTLVENLLSAGCIQTPRVEEAFREVPRHLFLPGVPLDQVYSDVSIATKLPPKCRPFVPQAPPSLDILKRSGTMPRSAQSPAATRLQNPAQWRDSHKTSPEYISS